MAKPKTTKGVHGFPFYGGDILAKMGAAWFVSYSYYVHVDETHTNWKNRTSKLRAANFEKSFSYHRYWLDKVADMIDGKLATNKIHLTADQIKKMAKAVMAAAW